MIERESTGDGWQVRFTPNGGLRIFRYAATAFLFVWLCGWMMGEYYAGGTLAGLLLERYAPGAQVDWLPHVRGPHGGAAFPVMIFLGCWVTMWTLGGLLAMRMLIVLLVGSPALRWSASGVELVSWAGLLTVRRRLTWDQAEALVGTQVQRVTRGGRLAEMLATPLFDPADREQLLGWLREARTGGAAETEQVRAIG